MSRTLRELFWFWVVFTVGFYFFGAGVWFWDGLIALIVAPVVWLFYRWALLAIANR